MAHANTTHFRWLSTSLGLGLAALVSAQGLALQDLLPEIGSTWHMRALQVVPVEELPVEPVIWPYDGLVGNDLFGVTYTVLEPNEVSGSNAYAGADRVVRSIPDNSPAPTHTFYDVMDDKTLELGSLGPVLSTNFDPGAMVQAYPLELGEVVTGSFCFVSRSVGGEMDYCGTTRITLENRGTLELPFGTYRNVQLLSTRRATAISGTTDSTITISRDWYADGIPYPMVHFGAVTNPDGSTSRSGQIIDEASLVGISEPLRMERLLAYPNPTKGQVTIEAGEPGELAVYGGDGRLVHAERIAAQEQTTVDLGQLPEGVYSMVLRSNKVQRSAVVVVAR